MTSTSSTKRSTSAPRVFLGLSGGVDSAVSAALLQRQGYEVVGVFIRIVVEGYPCTAGQDRIDAMRVAAHLRIPFKEIDLSREYKEKVFDASIEEFEKGETPNPDALCNREIKFGLFYDWARAQGADVIATGHYARIAPAEAPSTGSGRRDDTSLARTQELPPPQVELLSGRDTDKDQSYFLALVPETALRHALFPIGTMLKEEVRALARKFGLPNAARPDSQGLCFLGPVSMEEMLGRELRLRRGKVRAEDGTVIGEHDGAARYTLGQRHGFTLTKQSPDAPPHYVVAKDIASNTLTVSPSRFPSGAAATRVRLRGTNWIGERGEGPCLARYRYRQKLIPALLRGDEVVLEEPHYVPRGQVMALYRGERCLGGGIIDGATLK